MMNILYEIGEYGPVILVFISWFLLWNNKNLFFYYNIGIFTNAIINIILKGIIQEPRPLFDQSKINLIKLHAKYHLFQNGIPFNIFGMPSGHAQAVFFSTVFIYLSLRQKNLLFIYIPLSLLTCIQRISLEYHSIFQIIVGSILGSIYSYFIYNLAREKIKGRIKEKPDDNAPI